MSIDVEDMHQAINEAKTTIRRADRVVSRMADLVAGHLEAGDVAHSTLKQLKEELRNYNVHTGRWKE